jgi:hypothetical protein
MRWSTGRGGGGAGRGGAGRGGAGRGGGGAPHAPPCNGSAGPAALSAVVAAAHFPRDLPRAEDARVPQRGRASACRILRLHPPPRAHPSQSARRGAFGGHVTPSRSLFPSLACAGPAGRSDAPDSRGVLSGLNPVASHRSARVRTSRTPAVHGAAGKGIAMMQRFSRLHSSLSSAHCILHRRPPRVGPALCLASLVLDARRIATVGAARRRRSSTRSASG